MRRWLAAGLALMLATGPVHARDCALVPLDERVQDIMNLQMDPSGLFRATPALGTGQLSRPQNLTCDATDWTGYKICNGLQSFTGTLYSVHGIAEVTGAPVHSTFYELTLEIAPDDQLAFWRPWTSEEMLIAFNQPVDGPLQLRQVDDCVNGIIRPATPELDNAIAACHGRRACPAPARAVLRAQNLLIY